MRAAERLGIRQLRAFRAVANYGHFTKAADALGMSQPALSAAISQLEATLGVRLFNRTSRSVELTQGGVMFLATAERVLSELDWGIKAAKEYTDLERGVLRIGALPSLCSGMLPNLLQNFRAKHPRVRLSVLDLTDDEIMQLISTRSIDLGLGNFFESPAANIEYLFSDRLIVVGRKDYLPISLDIFSWYDLQNFEVIAMAIGTSVRKLIDAGSHQANVKLNIVLEPKQVSTAIAYTISGLGVAILPSGALPDALPIGLVRAELVDPVVKRNLSVVRASQVTADPPVSRFLHLLKNAVTNQRLGRELINEVPGY